MGNVAKRSIGVAKRSFKIAEQTERTIKTSTIEWIDVGVLAGLYLVVIAALPAKVAVLTVKQNVNRMRSSHLAKFIGLDTPVEPGSQPVDIKTERALRDGDVVSGWRVTSPRGIRTHPVTGEQKMHEGVDLGTPTGTALFAPAATVVLCGDYGGGGTGASFDLDGYIHTFMHLSQCTPGSYQPGDKFAESGNSGSSSTGEHLHYQMQSLIGRKMYKEPNRSLLASVLSGKALGATSGEFTEKYKAAIAKQESGNSYSSVNSGSGAMGKFQFMPETAKAMAGKCGLPNVSSNEFIGNPDLQEQTMDCYVEASGIDDANENTRCRKLASYHYSGDPDLYDDGKQQSYAGKNYPSISNYTSTVCKEFQ